MNNALLDRLSPRPACPLVRLGRTTPPLLDNQQPSSSGSQNDDPDDYYMHNMDKRNLELYRRKINDRFYETSFQITKRNSNPRNGTTINNNAANKNYYNRPDAPLNSLSLSAGLAYWESCKSMQSSDSSQECPEFFHTGRSKIRDSLRDTCNFTPNTNSKTKTAKNSNNNSNKIKSFTGNGANNANSDCDYLMDSFLKFGKNSPSLDQGYHTLVPPSPGCSTPIWDRCETQLYRGKSRFHARNNSFDRLQDDLVMKIFTMLNSYELSVCARVCRRFDRLVWKPELWRTINLAGESLSGDRAIRAVLRQLCGQGTTGACTQVERVHITDGAKITDKGVTLLARRCPEITHLQITQTSGVTNVSLNEIVNRCGNLQHLDVTGCVQVTCLINMMGPDPPKRLQLQYLDLTDCATLQDNGLRIIVRNCPLLAYLYLRRCTDISDAGLKFVPSFCSGLRELSVSDCTNITDFGLYELAKLGATLRYLSVAKCDQVSDAGLKVVARRCYKLRYLNVRGCEAVSDDAITVLARSCTRLRALDIGKCDVSDAGLRALAESCPNLKKLSLRNCDLVTDRGVQAIAYYCRGLQQLNIQDCQISLDGYRAVKKYCKRCIIEHTNPGFC